MAQKDLTYLRFDGSGTNNYGATAGSVISSTEGSFVFTIFVRLLEWPATCAPICQQAYDGGPGSENTTFGLFWYNNNFAESSRGPSSQTGDDLCLGFQYKEDSSPTSETLVSMTGTSGVPAKLGNIYQIQVVLWEDGSDLRVALFVDGVSRLQTVGVGGSIDSGVAGDVLRVGGPSILGFDGKTLTEERACMDIIQFMYENGRTITKTGSDIDPPDSHLDPWEELVVDASATAVSSQAFTLEEGTGSPSGTMWTNPDWADETEIDPQIDEGSGTIDWNFDNVYGYGEDEEDAYPQPVLTPIGSRSNPTAGELRLRLLPNVWSEHGSTDSDQWSSSYALAPSTAQVAEGHESVLAATTVAGNSASRAGVVDHGGFTSPGQGRWFRLWHYDKGGTSTNIINRFQIVGGTANWVGVLFSVSTGHYATRVGTGGNVSTGVTRSTGWHEWVMYLETAPFLGNEQCRIWLDGQLVRSETLANCGADNNQPNTRIRATLAADQAHIDWWGWNRQDSNTPAEFQGLVASTATAVLPLAQPAGSVTSFDSVTIDDEDAGTNSQEIGTLTYTFRHSDDGGSTWNTAAALNDTNLQALTPAGGGLDVIEVSVQLDSGLDDCATPAVRGITINYSSGIIPLIMHHRRQMAGAC